MWVVDLRTVSVVRVDESYLAWSSDEFLGPFDSCYEAQKQLQRYVRTLENKATQYDRLIWSDDSNEIAFGWQPT